MNRKNIVIWLRSSQKETFTTAYHKGASYLQLAERLAARNNLYFAFNADSHLDDGVFHPVSRYHDGAITEPIGEKIKTDVIYNLGNIPDETFSTGSTVRISNTPAFRKFFSSKWNAYQLLPEFFPKTIFIDSDPDFFAALKNITTGNAVLKPNTGTGGKGVRIFQKTKPELDNEMRVTIAEGALLQEFIDTKDGIAGICGTHHDLRLAVVNNTIALTHVRIPAPGSLIANYQQGATIKELARETDLPKTVIALYEKVHATITARFPDPMYTMDVGIGADGVPLLFEINGTTTFPWSEFESKDFFIEALATHLEKLAAYCE
jgi:hypothetical protein